MSEITIPKSHIAEIAALLKFRDYCVFHDPPIIWRETASPDFGFDGEIEFTQKDKNKNVVPTGQIVKVVIKAVSRFHEKRMRITLRTRDLEFYKKYTLEVLLVAYDADNDRLFVRKLSDIMVKTEILHQTIEFNEAHSLSKGDNELLALLGISQLTPASLENNLPSKLLSCPSGREHWKDYENICTSIIDFLFHESFRNYLRIIQARNDNGLDIKDLVVPNRSMIPFWNEIRMDYDARNIIFEFKNYGESIGKDQLVQISNYLKKRTYGRFGCIFCRKGLSENGIEEQKELLRDDDKMIIVLSDEDVIELINQKNRGIQPETIIEKMKTELELSI